jgi:hypothetical protein
MADLRETIIPVCKLVEVANVQVGDGSFNASTIPLLNTAIGLKSLSMTDTSGFALGTSSFTASGGVIGTGHNETSATFDIITTRKNTSELESKIVIINPGVYQGLAGSGLVLAGQADAATAPVGVLPTGTSATITGVMESGEAAAPYISVTDLSGTEGFFRVIPSRGASGNAYVASAYDTQASANCTSAIQHIGATASALAGVIAPAGGTAVLTLPPSLPATEIIIEVSQPGQSSLFAINYGVIKRASALRDQQLPDVK